MPSRLSPGFEADGIPASDVESGYGSGNSSQASTPEICFTTPHLTFLNRQLQNLEPQGKPFGLPLFPFVSLHLGTHRNPAMVNNHSPFVVPDDLIRSDWPGDYRYVFKDEGSKTSGRGSYLLRYPTSLP